MTNENMRLFVTSCWENGSKPKVEQGKKWLNHALTSNKMPPLNRYSAQKYSPTLDLLKGISKEAAWREHRPATTDAFDLNTCKRLFHADTNKLNGEPDLLAIRNKALSVTMIVNGWHPIDAYRITDEDVIDLHDYHDRTGEHRPKIIFKGRNVHHTKERSIKVKNTVGCGCLHSHNPAYNHCFYNVIKKYMDHKDLCDEYFVQYDLRKLNKEARQLHLNEHGELKPKGFFRAMTRGRNERCTCTGTGAHPPEHGRRRHPRRL